MRVSWEFAKLWFRFFGSGAREFFKYWMSDFLVYFLLRNHQFVPHWKPKLLFYWLFLWILLQAFPFAIARNEKKWRKILLQFENCKKLQFILIPSKWNGAYCIVDVVFVTDFEIHEPRYINLDVFSIFYHYRASNRAPASTSTHCVALSDEKLPCILVMNTR